MQTESPKRLIRSRTDRMIAGICGGLAQYFNLDVSIIRILFVVLTIFTAGFPGVLVYIIMWIVVPEQ
jgi:phage shock protein C